MRDPEDLASHQPFRASLCPHPFLKLILQSRGNGNEPSFITQRKANLKVLHLQLIPDFVKINDINSDEVKRAKKPNPVWFLSLHW